MARRPYGSGSLDYRTDRNGRETWYGHWSVRGRKREKALGLKRQRGSREGLTRAEAERELRRLIDSSVVTVQAGRRKTIEDAGTLYIEHLRVVKGRKRTTLADYKGYLHGHFVP